jgi:hypothetical protein
MGGQTRLFANPAQKMPWSALEYRQCALATAAK